MNKALPLALFSLSFSLAFSQVDIDKSINLSGSAGNAKISGIKQVAAAQDAVSAEALQKGNLQYAVATGTGSAYTLSLTPAITAYVDGMEIRFKAPIANTGAVTLNVNSVGSLPIKKNVGTALAPNDITAGQLVSVIYDAANSAFQLASRIEQLANTATAGTYNNVTINSQGLVTGGSNTAYLTGNQSISLTSDVTGSGTTSITTTVAKINGVALGSTAATGGNLLIGSGTQWVSTPVTGDATLSAAGALSLAQTSNNYIKNQTIGTQTAAFKINGQMQGSIFYDNDNTAYFDDPSSTTNLNNLRFVGADCINGNCPPNGAIRLTPNLHLNAGAGYAVILNWDNGTTSGQALRIGNGSSVDAFNVYANGNVTIQSKLALEGDDSWLRLNQSGGFTNGTYTPGFLRADGGIASGAIGSLGAGTIHASGQVRAPIFYDYDNTGYYLDPSSTSNLNNLRFAGVDCINGTCPPNGAIRMTPNLHLNSGAGSAVILNWDNGTTSAGSQTLRIGNGAGSDVFNVFANGEVRAPVYKDIDNTAYYVDPNGTSIMNTIKYGGASGAGAGTVKLNDGDNNIFMDWTGSQLKFWVDATNVKNFIIDHPIDKDKYLVHTTLEGPENAVFYRGTAKLENGVATVTLPSYFSALTAQGSATVVLTPKGKTPYLLSYDDFSGNTFKVYGTNTDAEFDWRVEAKRKDVPDLFVEPYKSQIEVKGDGPYKYYGVKHYMAGR